MDLVTKFNEYASLNPEALPMIYDVMRTVTMRICSSLFSMNNPTVHI